MNHLKILKIKTSVGKFRPEVPLEDFITDNLRFYSIGLINVSLRHLGIIATLPLHHRDPFDRLLIAQSMAENIPIVSADSSFDTYPITRLWS
jgi:PIN domain nuclease of toxin-antitoxin system